MLRNNQILRRRKKKKKKKKLNNGENICNIFQRKGSQINLKFKALNRLKKDIARGKKKQNQIVQSVHRNWGDSKP